jgi:DNA-binding response OmpR family regulator
MRLLLVEDNEQLSQLLVKGLDAAGFMMDAVGTASEAVAALAAVAYAAVVLDLGLPDGDGLSVLRDLRGRNDPTPVLVLTARAGVRHRITGLRSGADDYMAKPFDLEELVARLQAVLRRSPGLQSMSLRLGNVALDREVGQVSVSGAVQYFSPREVAVLEILMRRSGRVVPKKMIEDHLFGLSGEVGSNAVEVYVHRLRKELADVAANVEIHTIRGVGYLIGEKK